MNEPQTTFLPNLFVLGAAKCGTTTLHGYLDSMPDVCMSRPKEPHFFEAEFEKGLSFYRERYFGHWRGEPVVGESRHRNLYLPFVPERIVKTNPDARLVVLVRDPVERAFSHWYHWHWQNRDPLSFDDAIREDLARIEKGLRCDTPAEQQAWAENLGPDERGNTGFGIYRTYVDSGYYAEQIERYLRWFPREQLKVYLFEDLTRDPANVVEELIAFLELDAVRNQFVEPRWDNPANLPPRLKSLAERLRLEQRAPRSMVRAIRRIAGRWRRRQFDPRTRNFLYEHYRPHNERLSNLLNRDLSHWNPRPRSARVS